MKKKFITGIVATGFILGGAFAVSAMNNKGDESAGSAVSNQITAEEAKKIALDKYGGQIEEVEVEKNQSGTYYDVELYTDTKEIEITIDADTGNILVEEIDDIHNDENEKSGKTVEKSHTEKQSVKTAAGKNKELISTKEAIKIAENKTGAKVDEIELGEDDGKTVYEIELITGHTEYELTIDAFTGKILEMETDDMDDDHLDD